MQAQGPASADQILKRASTAAEKENKNVFVIFHASWCGWCHKMDTAMNDASVKKFFTDNYVIEHLTVLESDKNKALENPGASDLLTKYKGDKGGIPFWLVFDSKGKLLADSKRRKEGDVTGEGDNTGCPATEQEVDYFVSVLKKTSNLNDSQLSVISKLFRKNEN
jgi:thiol-disulfide isomerase/thioredoxin